MTTPYDSINRLAGTRIFIKADRLFIPVFGMLSDRGLYEPLIEFNLPLHQCDIPLADRSLLELFGQFGVGNIVLIRPDVSWSRR